MPPSNRAKRWQPTHVVRPVQAREAEEDRGRRAMSFFIAGSAPKAATRVATASRRGRRAARFHVGRRTVPGARSPVHHDMVGGINLAAIRRVDGSAPLCSPH